MADVWVFLGIGVIVVSCVVIMDVLFKTGR